MDEDVPSTSPVPEKKVGFAPRLTLKIPPPSVPDSNFPPPKERKASQYVFDQINELRHYTVDTAKSSIGIGEKFAYWLYHKIKALSKKWFTHCFLTIVLIIYTIGGAISFKTIEEPHEGTVKGIDIRLARYTLIEEVTNLSRQMPYDNQTEQWMELANERMNSFFGIVIENRKIEAFIKANRGDKVWTIWNSIVFCATIYTTIGMDLKLTSNEPTCEEIIVKNENTTYLTDDLSSNNSIGEVPRKNVRNRRRRNYSANKREATPVRYLEETPVDEISKEVVDDSKEKHEEYVSEQEIVSCRPPAPSNSHKSSKKIRENGLPTPAKTESISDIAQNELLSLFNKTKKSITSAAIRGRDRFRKYEQQLAKRSQSAPQQFAEELRESLKKVEPLQEQFLPKRKYSDSNLNISRISCDSNGIFLPRKRRSHTRSLTSPKIIEILDPKTSNVIIRKTVNERKEALKPLAVVSLLDIYRNYKLHKIQCKYEYDNIKKILRKCACELFLIMVFCGFGGLLFKFTEGTFETFYKCGVKRVKRDFVDLLWTKSHNLREDDWKSLARNKLRSFEDELHNAHEAGMTDYSGQRSWSFLNGIVYSLTIITTIGYGHMYPKTHTGRALSIVYALIGIPLFLIALTDFGKLFTRCIKFFWSFVRRLYYTGSCRRARKTAAAGDIMKGAQMFYEIATFRRPSELPNTQNSTDTESQPQTTDTPTTPAISNFEIDDEFNLPISVALFILVAYIICGAVMYMLIEQWEFFEAFYFVFISMSTIGFGDYVPRDPVFMIGSIIYLVFGLALMSMCINVVQDKLSDTFKEASAKIGATMGLEVDEDGSIITASPENVNVYPVFVPNSTDSSNEEK